MTLMNAVRSAETEAARSARQRLADGKNLLPADAALAAFFDALYAGAVPDDVLRSRSDQLAALATALWAELSRRASGSIHVTALELGHETVLVAINDDRPFLFDSALAATLAGGARLRAAFHPILDIRGTRTSVIALVCDTMDHATREALIASLREAFGQGAAAVRDWKPMLARLAAARADLERNPPKRAASTAISAKTSPSWTGWRTIISRFWARAIMCWPGTAPTACWNRSRAAAWACCPTKRRGWSMPAEAASATA